jgi:hypothetical protein
MTDSPRQHKDEQSLFIKYHVHASKNDLEPSAFAVEITIEADMADEGPKRVASLELIFFIILSTLQKRSHGFCKNICYDQLRVCDIFATHPSAQNV